MNLRSSDKKTTAVAVALGVAAAEGASVLYFWFVPWFLRPDPRGMETSLACNAVMFLIINNIVTQYWGLKKWQDAGLLALRIASIYVLIQAPYLITWYNPMTYTYLIGPFTHAFVQLSAMSIILWYLKNKK